MKKDKKFKNLKFTPLKLSKQTKAELANLPFSKLIIAAFVINILTVLFVLIFKRRLPPEVPLYYGLARGPQQLAGSINLIIPNIVSVVVLVINTLFAFFLKDEFIKKALIMSAVAGSILAFVAVFKIAFLVGDF